VRRPRQRPAHARHRGGPGRLAKQLVTLAKALAIVRSETVVSTDTYRVIEHIGRDCVPALRRQLFDVLVDRAGERLGPGSTTTIADQIGYPTKTTHHYLEELVALGLADRLVQGEGKADLWIVRKDAIALFEAARQPLAKDAGQR
jgi:hypothetical protein